METAYKNHGLDLDREKAELRGDEWQFGEASPACIFAVPLNLRRSYLPAGELQRGKEDFQDCATRGPINLWETKFTYAYRHNVILPALKTWLKDNGYVVTRNGNEFIEFSDRYISIKSGTTRQGNSMKNPCHAIYQYGLIPKRMFPAGDFTWGEYNDPSKITAAMEELAKAFKLRFPMYYEQVPFESTTALLQRDFAALGVYAWPEIQNGEYHAVPGTLPNHVVLGFQLPQTYVFDNYPDDAFDGVWIKKLSSDYSPFYHYGYRMYITNQVIPEEVEKKILDLKKTLNAIIEILNAIFPPHAYDVPPASLPMNQDPVTPQPAPTVKPAPQVPTKLSNREKLLAQAKFWLGKEASPADKAPDDLACVESICNVMRAAGLPAPDTLSTATFHAWINAQQESFSATLDLLPGNIILCATGEGKTGVISNGHVGVILEGGKIASNNSNTGLWDDVYTVETWVDRWRTKGGYPVHVYQPLN